MMNTTVAGKLYNGKVHDWVQKRDGDNEDRQLFRGRLNYRSPENGEYYFIDAVCFKDFGNNGGLVSWLDEHFSMENSDSEKGGDPIIVTGYIRPTEKKKTIEIKGKKNGKTVSKEIPNVPYETFEFVILSATFVPGASTSSKSNDVETDEDFDDLDDIEISGDEGEETEVEEKEEKKSSKPKSNQKSKEKTSSKKKQEKESADEDDDFFEDDKS